MLEGKDNNNLSRELVASQAASGCEAKDVSPDSAQHNVKMERLNDNPS